MEAQAEMAKRGKVSCEANSRIELLLRKIASKFNFRRLKSHRALVNKYCATVERVKAKHPPPSGR